MADRKAPSSSEAPSGVRLKSHTSGGHGAGMARRRRMEPDGPVSITGASEAPGKGK